MRGPELGETYTCAHCGKSYEADRTDAEALIEYQETFSESERASAPPVIICDDCWRNLHIAERAAVNRELCRGAGEGRKRNES